MTDLMKMLQPRSRSGSGNGGFPHQRQPRSPSSLMHNLKHNKVMHERVVLMYVRPETAPRVAAGAPL